MKHLITFYFRHKKLCVALMALVTVVFVMHAPDIAFAEAAPKKPDVTTNEILNTINQGFNVLLLISAQWLWPILLMIGSLLDNDLIFGGAMGDRLLGIWVQVRNLVNIVFVLILLAIAVYNVLGLGEESGGMNLGLKQVMPKFVLALIAVNFSFLAVKVVLDFTNVMTGVVFALPSTTIAGQPFKTEEIEKICRSSSSEAPLKMAYCDGTKMSDKAKNFFSKLDRSNITLAYAIRFGRAHQLKFIRNGLKDLTQLGFNVIFNAVLYVVYAVSFVVLFLVLVSRVIVLWVAVVLSPLMALTIVLPNLKSAAGGDEIQKQFITHAIAPIKIGLVLAVGYIMLDGFAADQSIHGEVLATSTLSSADPNALPTDIDNLQQLMIAIASVVIIWVGVFKMAEGTAASFITDKIKSVTQDWGKFMAKLPTFIPAIPFKGKGGRMENKSVAQILNQAQTLPGQLTNKWSQWDKPKAIDEQGYKRDAAANNVSELVKRIKASPDDLDNKVARDALLGTLKDLKTRNGEPLVGDELKRASDTARGTAEALITSKTFRDHYGDTTNFVRDASAKPTEDLTAATEKAIETEKDLIEALISDRDHNELSKNPKIAPGAPNAAAEIPQFRRAISAEGKITNNKIQEEIANVSTDRTPDGTLKKMDLGKAKSLGEKAANVQADLKPFMTAVNPKLPDAEIKIKKAKAEGVLTDKILGALIDSTDATEIDKDKLKKTTGIKS